MTLVVVPYDPRWVEVFEAERRLLQRLLEPWLGGDIHHIGSTSVPGLAAKPIIDMMAGVRSLSEARAAFAVLTAHSYRYTGHRREEAHHFAKALGGVPTHGLHLTKPESALWRERLAFRDALRTDASLAGEYDALKRRLAKEHNDATLHYTSEKRPFVARVLAEQGIEIAVR